MNNLGGTGLTSRVARCSNWQRKACSRCRHGHCGADCSLPPGLGLRGSDRLGVWHLVDGADRNPARARCTCAVRTTKLPTPIVRRLGSALRISADVSVSLSCLTAFSAGESGPLGEYPACAPRAPCNLPPQRRNIQGSSSSDPAWRTRTRPIGSNSVYEKRGSRDEGGDDLRRTLNVVKPESGDRLLPPVKWMNFWRAIVHPWTMGVGMKEQRISRRVGIPTPRSVVLLVAGWLAVSPICGAEPIPFGQDRFRLALGAFVTDLDTQMRIGLPDLPLPPPIDFEDNLGLDSSDQVLRADGYIRLAPRHRIFFDYYSIDRDGQKTLTRDIQWEDQTFTIGLDMRSELKWRIIPVSYAYSFYKSDHMEAAASFGVHWVDYQATTRAVGVLSGAALTDEESSGEGPLPVIGLRADYSPTTKWVLGASAQYLGLDTDDTEGSMLDLKLSAEYMVFRNVGAGFAYNYFSLDADQDRSDWRGTIDLDHRGALLYGVVRF